MRIVIDLQGAQTASRFRGIGRYTMALTRGIVRHAAHHEVWLVLNGALEESVLELRRTFAGLVPPERIRVFEPPGRVAERDPHARARARAAEILREHFIALLAPDVVLVTSLFEGYVDDAVGSVGRFVDGARSAVILYDLIPLLNADTYLSTPVLQQFYMRKIDSLRRAGMLLAISDYAREEAIQALGLAPQAIQAISTAVDETFTPTLLDPDALESIRRRFGVTRAMVMCAPGGYDPRKNIFGLVKAFGLLPPPIRASHQLLIASRLSPVERAELEAHAVRCKLDPADLVLTGYVSDADLIGLYQAAALFVFPSLHEGFGLPVLEAMACGAPAIGSNSTSIPEVIGLEEAMFDPHDPQAIADKIAAVLSDPALHARLRAHGPLQAEKFSWDHTARRALRALEALAASQPAPAAPSYEALLDALAAVPDLAHDDITTLYLATCLAGMPDLAAQPRVYIDVGACGASILKTLSAWQSTNPHMSFEPLMLSNAGGVWHYRYADSETAYALGLRQSSHTKCVASLRFGDLLITCSNSPTTSTAHQSGLYTHLYRSGINMIFSVDRKRDIPVGPDNILDLAHQLIETEKDLRIVLDNCFGCNKI